MPEDLPVAGAPARPQPRLDARSRPCDGRLAMVTLTVRDAAGAAVTGARLVTYQVGRRGGERTRFPVQPQETGAGEYLLLDDTALRFLPAGDAVLEVTATHGKGRAAVRQVIGTTANRCHVVRRDGPERLTLR